MPRRNRELPPELIDALQMHGFPPDEQEGILRMLERVAGIAHRSWERYNQAILAKDPVKQLPVFNLQSAALHLRHAIGHLLERPNDSRHIWETVLRLSREDALPSRDTGSQEEWPYAPLRPKQHQRYAIRWVMQQKGNCLIVKPTGFGKTLDAAKILEETLREVTGGREGHARSSKAFMCILTAPTKPLVAQHIASFDSGKYGAVAKEMLAQGSLRIDTPHKFMKEIEHFQDIAYILLFVDEGDYGIQAGTGDYPIFPLAKLLGCLENRSDRRLVALTATAKGRDMEGFRTMLSIEHVLSEETDKPYARLLELQRRKRMVRIEYCPATWEHHFIVEQMQQWLLEEIHVLRDCFVHDDPDKKHFPRFPVPELDPEKIPSITHDVLEDILHRLTAIEEQTFERDDVVHVRKRRSLRGLWHRTESERQDNGELSGTSKRELRKYRRALYGFRSLIDLYHTTDCNSYAPLLGKVYTAGEEIAALEARKLLAKSPCTIESVSRFLGRFERIDMPFYETLENIRRTLLRLRVWDSLPEPIHDDQREVAWNEIIRCLRELADIETNSKHDSEEERSRIARLYKFFHNKWLRRAVEGIQRVGAHPKEQRFLETIPKMLAKPDARILASIQYKTTLFHLFDVLRKNGIPADFLIGGGGTQIAAHNALARKRFESGEIRLLLGTSVTDRGMDLRGANILAEYDLSFSDRQRVQRHGRVGRSDAIMAECCAFLLNRRGSRDEILARLITEGNWNASEQCSANASSAKGALSPPNLPKESPPDHA